VSIFRGLVSQEPSNSVGEREELPLLGNNVIHCHNLVESDEEMDVDQSY
jgi:hypothetical protein